MPSWGTLCLAALPLSVLALHTLALMLPRDSAAARQASFFARLLASWAMLVLCACYGVVASVALRVAGLGGLGQWTTARAFKWTMWVATGVAVEVVRGEEYLDPWSVPTEDEGKDGARTRVVGERRARVLVGNHQTELDVLVLGCIFPKYTSVTAKKSLRWMPFLGWFMALSKTIFIDRGNRQAAVSAFDSAAATMHNERQSVFIFPEGTRSYADHPMLLPFKKGAFHLAIQAQVPIVPCVCANYSHVLNVKKRIFNAGTIPVSVLKPIETKGMKAEDAAALCDRVRDLMLEELMRLDKEIKAQNGHLNGSTSQAKQASGQRRAMASGVDAKTS